MSSFSFGAFAGALHSNEHPGRKIVPPPALRGRWGAPKAKSQAKLKASRRGSEKKVTRGA